MKRVGEAARVWEGGLISAGDPQGRPPPDRFGRLCEIADLADPERAPARAAELDTQWGVAVFPVHPNSKVTLIKGGRRSLWRVL